ncbi:MAG: hypothetical protein IKG27_05810 [Bacilli bacterium]|nr:hypothetical protein [Bacilli bacterium]
MDKINEIINRVFRTNEGYKYILNLISKRYPTLKINEENLKKIDIEKMDLEYHLKTSFFGEYVAERNTIKIYFGDKNEKISDMEIIETFTHELIHLLTSTYDKDGTLLQGFNMRDKEKGDSFFIGINEGITQMMTEEVLDITNSTAYPFHTNIARKLSIIIGEEELIQAYSKHDIDAFVAKLFEIDNNLDVRSFIIKSYFLHLVTMGYDISDAIGLGTEIEDLLNNLYINSKKENDEEYFKLLIDQNDVDVMAKHVPDKIMSSSRFLYYGIIKDKDKIKNIIKRRRQNGRK